MFPSSASLATASSDDEGPDVRRGPAAPPRVVAFDDSDDGDASDGDVGRGPPLVARGPGPARYGSADPVDAPAALSNSIDEYGVAEEHEAAMTHLLSASVGARSYGGDDDVDDGAGRDVRRRRVARRRRRRRRKRTRRSIRKRDSDRVGRWCVGGYGYGGI